MVAPSGFEPEHPLGPRILNPLRLPIPPRGLTSRGVNPRAISWPASVAHERPRWRFQWKLTGNIDRGIYGWPPRADWATSGEAKWGGGRQGTWRGRGGHRCRTR